MSSISMPPGEERTTASLTTSALPQMTFSTLARRIAIGCAAADSDRTSRAGSGRGLGAGAAA
jgi:hypothetical protein